MNERKACAHSVRAHRHNCAGLVLCSTLTRSTTHSNDIYCFGQIECNSRAACVAHFCLFAYSNLANIHFDVLYISSAASNLLSFRFTLNTHCRLMLPIWMEFLNKYVSQLVYCFALVFGEIIVLYWLPCHSKIVSFQLSDAAPFFNGKVMYINIMFASTANIVPMICQRVLAVYETPGNIELKSIGIIDFHRTIQIFILASHFLCFANTLPCIARCYWLLFCWTFWCQVFDISLSWEPGERIVSAFCI